MAVYSGAVIVGALPVLAEVGSKGLVAAPFLLISVVSQVFKARQFKALSIELVLQTVGVLREDFCETLRII